MGEPGAIITVSLVAQTEAAQARLDAFFSKIKTQLAAGNAPISFASPAALAQGVAGFKQLENAAAQVNTRIAGMSYYFRSAIDGIRVAMAGGGARAGFYAIDEAVRGLIASGLGLSVLAPILLGLAAAVGGGALVWWEYTSAEREAEKAARDLHDRLKATADLLVQMRDLQKAGLLSDEAVQRNRDILSGKIKVYKDSTTGVLGTPNYIEQDANKPAPKLTQPKDSVIPLIGPLAAFLPQLKALEGTDLTKYVQGKLSVPGGLDPEQTKAFAQLKELEAQVHEKNISDKDLEIQKIHEKADAERTAIMDKATVSGNLMTEEARVKRDQAIQESKDNEGTEILQIERKVQEEQTKINEQYARGRAEFARLANEKLDRDLEASAAQQGETRGQIYQEEYNKRIGLLQFLKFASVLSEQQYTDAVQEATTKRLEGYRKEQDELRRIAEIKGQLTQRDFEYQRKQIEQNPFLSAGQKNTSLLGVNSEQTDAAASALQANQSALATEQNPEKQIQLLQQEKEILGQLNGLYLERQKLAEDAPGFLNQWTSSLSKLNGEWTDLGGNAAKQAINIMQDGLNSVSSSITDMIFRTKNWGEVFYSSMRKAVSGIVEMATQYVASKSAMAAVDAVFTAKSKANAATTVATSGTAGIAQAGAQGGWVGVLIYMGVFLAAMAAMEAIAAGISGGFKEGGYTGDGPADEVAGLVHRGELVIPAPMLRSIRNGSLSVGSIPSSGGSSSAGPTDGGLVNHETHLHLAVVDSEESAKRVLEGEDGEKFWLSMADKHISKYQR